jgi:hypothetical protein
MQHLALLIMVYHWKYNQYGHASVEYGHSNTVTAMLPPGGGYFCLLRTVVANNTNTIIIIIMITTTPTT